MEQAAEASSSVHKVDEKHFRYSNMTLQPGRILAHPLERSRGGCPLEVEAVGWMLTQTQHNTDYLLRQDPWHRFEGPQRTSHRYTVAAAFERDPIVTFYSPSLSRP